MLFATKLQRFFIVFYNILKMKEESLKEQTERVLNELKRKGFNRDAIEKELGYSENYIDQQLSKGGNKRFLNAIVGLNARILPKATSKESSNVVEEPEVDYSQPIIQVVLNLSYTSKKNADSMDKMAATNQKNTEIIAALVGAILPNSKLANQLTSTLADLYKDDDRPVEDFLPKGTDLSRPLKEKQKAVTK